MQGIEISMGRLIIVSHIIYPSYLGKWHSANRLAPWPTITGLWAVLECHQSQLLFLDLGV